MRNIFIFMLPIFLGLVFTSDARAADKQIDFFSEHVKCAGSIYFPPGFSESGSFPAVVLAPGKGKLSR